MIYQLIAPTSLTATSPQFSGNNKNNIAQFYTNNRVIIFDADKNIIARGFEKFFNIGEKVAGEKQTIEKIESLTRYQQVDGF
jgi:tRNA splicing ligase